jgi:hypothetical protein
MLEQSSTAKSSNMQDSGSISKEEKIKLTIKDLLWVTNDGTQAGVGVKAGQPQADPTDAVSEDF